MEETQEQADNDLSLQDDRVEATAGSAMETMHPLLPHPSRAQQPSMQNLMSVTSAAMGALIRPNPADPVQVAAADAICQLLIQERPMGLDAHRTGLGLSGIPSPDMGQLIRPHTRQQLLQERPMCLDAHRTGLDLSGIPPPDMGALIRPHTRQQLLLQDRPMGLDAQRIGLGPSGIPPPDMGALIRTRIGFSLPAAGARTSPPISVQPAHVEQSNADEIPGSFDISPSDIPPSNIPPSNNQFSIFAFGDYMLGGYSNDPIWRLRFFASFLIGWGATVAVLIIHGAAEYDQAARYAVVTLLPTLIAVGTLAASFYIPPSSRCVASLFLLLTGAFVALMVATFVFPPN